MTHVTRAEDPIAGITALASAFTMSTGIRDWYPLESSPEVFTSVSRVQTPKGAKFSPKPPRRSVVVVGMTDQRHVQPEWGLDPRYAWVDILGLDDESLAAFEHEHGGEVHGVVLLFPDTPALVAHRRDEGPVLGVGKGEEVVYIQQVDVGHACGTFAMIHAFGVNGLAPKLASFYEQCRNVSFPERSRVFANSSLIKDAHNRHVDAGQTAIRENDWDDCDHFISFVKASVKGEDRLLEMDGVRPRKGPLDRGPCQNLLRDVAKVLQEVYLPRAAGERAGHFSMLALVGPESA